jgi:hypothetical protein
MAPKIGGETNKCTENLKANVRKLLCDKDKKELTYTDIKKGLFKFHPDKNVGKKNDEAVENYKIINNAKDECFENNSKTLYTIKCSGLKTPSKPTPIPKARPSPPPKQSAPPPPSSPPAPEKPKRAKPAVTINKDAECIRKVGTFSHIAPEFKMDKTSFDPDKLSEKLPIVSPKLIALIDKIKELDKADYDKDKKNYKHCIYIDFKGTYAKVVAAALIAYGFNMAYDNTMKIDEDDLLKTKGNNFAFLFE